VHKLKHLLSALKLTEIDTSNVIYVKQTDIIHFFNNRRGSPYWIHFINFVCTKGKKEDKTKTEQASPEEKIS
jgi:hypothetical protein